MDSSAYSAGTIEQEYYYDAESGYQDEAAALPEGFVPYGGYGHVLCVNESPAAAAAAPTPKVVERDDAILLAFENFRTLKTWVPDAANRHLWELAEDCVKKEDSAKQYAEDLIITGDYPLCLNDVRTEGIVDEDDELFLAALKYSSLKDIFPDAATSWVFDAAKDHATSSTEVFNRFVELMQETGDYLPCDLDGLPAPAKIEAKKQGLTRYAQEILSNIDSSYIEQQLNTEDALGYNEQGVSEMILNCMNNSQSCPSKGEEYYRRITQEAIKQYSGDFDIELFLQRFREPVKYFEKPANPTGPKYRADVFKYLRAVAPPQYSAEQIRRVQKDKKYLLACHRSFFGDSVPMGTIEYKLTNEGARFINELTYVRFYEIILPSAAKYASLMDICNRVDSEEDEWEDLDQMPCELCNEAVPLKKILTCSEAHMFCRECVSQWVNDRLENGYVRINCLELCEGTIPDDALKCILPDGGLDRLMKRRQDFEVGQAGVEGLINCLWCDYSYVPRSDKEDLVCLNPECGERWCPKCQQVAHHPNPCEDTPEEVKKRVFIEERMTRAAVRTCPQCTASIIKVDGCDFVQCRCGAGICYNCGQLSNHHHCTQPRAIFNVQAEGQQAKAEAERRFPNVKLNFDPTR